MVMRLFKMKKIADTGADKPRTVSSADLSYTVYVRFLSLVRIFYRLICPVSGFCPDQGTVITEIITDFQKSVEKSVMDFTD